MKRLTVFDMQWHENENEKELAPISKSRLVSIRRKIDEPVSDIQTGYQVRTGDREPGKIEVTGERILGVSGFPPYIQLKDL